MNSLVNSLATSPVISPVIRHVTSLVIILVMAWALADSKVVLTLESCMRYVINMSLQRRRCGLDLHSNKIIYTIIAIDCHRDRLSYAIRYSLYVIRYLCGMVLTSRLIVAVQCRYLSNRFVCSH